MAIISQDAIKLGCSGGQGKIQIQTLFDHAAKLVLQLSRTFYKSALFLQNKANFRKSQMDVKLNITSDYEKKTNRTLGENKPNQSQFSFPQSSSWRRPSRSQIG